MVWQNPKKWQICSPACADAVIHYGLAADSHFVAVGSHSQAEFMVNLIDEIVLAKAADCFGRSCVNQASRGNDRFLFEKTIGSPSRYERSFVSRIEIVAADYGRIPRAGAGCPE